MLAKEISAHAKERQRPIIRGTGEWPSCDVLDIGWFGSRISAFLLLCLLVCLASVRRFALTHRESGTKTKNDPRLKVLEQNPAKVLFQPIDGLHVLEDAKLKGCKTNSKRSASFLPVCRPLSLERASVW